ncbi:hypothetical protein KAH27_06780 [bacterium]|nr:hypothetical protein [bacterium]
MDPNPSHPENTASGSVVQDLYDNMILKYTNEHNNFLFQSNFSCIAMLAEVFHPSPRLRMARLTGPRQMAGLNNPEKYSGLSG